MQGAKPDWRQRLIEGKLTQNIMRVLVVLGEIRFALTCHQNVYCQPQLRIRGQRECFWTFCQWLGIDMQDCHGESCMASLTMA